MPFVRKQYELLARMDGARLLPAVCERRHARAGSATRAQRAGGIARYQVMAPDARLLPASLMRTP